MSVAIEHLVQTEVRLYRLPFARHRRILSPSAVRSVAGRVQPVLPLGLSMLWESRADPEVALRARFGFADFDAGRAWVTAAIDTTWGLSAAECSRMVISGQNATSGWRATMGPWW